MFADSTAYTAGTCERGAGSATAGLRAHPSCTGSGRLLQAEVDFTNTVCDMHSSSGREVMHKLGA